MARQSIHQVHIADGFADDCEELIHRCLKAETLTYEVFCEIWKDKQFGYLYHGRPSGAEMAELSEELLHISKHYMVANTSNFEESVAGLFIVYGILNLQPYPGFAPLRIVPEDIPAIHRIETVARRQKRYDVLYILGFILIEGPVEYHAVARERGMESGIRKYLEGYTSIDRLGVRPKGVFYRQTEELDIIRELNCITRRYSDAKKAIKGENSRNLNFINENLATELDSSLKRILNGVVENNKEADDMIKDHYVNVQTIKERAMKLSVDHVKYLQSSSSKNKSPVKKSQTSCEIKQIPGKIRQGSPKKLVTGPRKLTANKRKRHTSEDTDSSTSEDSDIKPSDLEDTDDDDLDIDKFDKEHADAMEEKEVNIEVESLPVFISTEHEGKTIEIEFIDKCANDEEDNMMKKLAQLKDISVEPIDEYDEGTSFETAETSESISESVEVIASNAKPSKEPVLLKKPDKRDLKKSLLKSKFRRMGMLKVANFDEKQIQSDNKN